MGNCCDGRDQKSSKQIFIIGPPGSGKSKLTEKLSNNKKYEFIDIPELDMESSIKSREKSIENFQKQYKKSENDNKQIIGLILCVKFERTDLMKRNLLSVIKFFRQFKNLMILVVTHFDLSENQNQDKRDLKKSLNYLLDKDEERVMFSNNFEQDGQEVIDQAIQKIIEKKNELQFTLKNTIFEEFDESEQKKLLQNMQQSFNKC
ncbi:unnamed protein product [Paramecium sonneborni]|uniref:ATPase AAA-type core domain-containing protein n=1 Tax=Paramecium sonneborni TaxID=65129 RepID=A0A8S1R6K7_9CILI|nr:unnamed protein product [Paramecium sonneborni]